MTAPLFSIIIPTKDRPHFLSFVLQSLMQQSEEDFECIVVNNSEIEEKTKKTFRLVQTDSRFQYVRPEKRLPMHENWELGVSKAKGKYVSFVMDKMLLLPNCLAMAKNTLEKKKYDILNWWSETYNFDDEISGFQGKYVPSWELRMPEAYNAQKEINRRLSFIRSRNNEGRLYFRGKICFGVYHKDIIQKIKNRGGKVFNPFSPDYTSLAAALSVANKIYDMGMPGCLSINSILSNGYQGAMNTQNTINFIKETDPHLTCAEYFPVPGLLDSIHNFVAYDYLTIFKLFSNNGIIKFNRKFLMLRIQEDLFKKNINIKVLSMFSFYTYTALNKLNLIFDGFFIEQFIRKLMLELSKFLPYGEKYKDENTHRLFCLKTHPCGHPLEAIQLAHKHYLQFNYLPYNLKN